MRSNEEGELSDFPTSYFWGCDDSGNKRQSYMMPARERIHLLPSKMHTLRKLPMLSLVMSLLLRPYLLHRILQHILGNFGSFSFTLKCTYNLILGEYSGFQRLWSKCKVWMFRMDLGKSFQVRVVHCSLATQRFWATHYFTYSDWSLPTLRPGDQA